MGRSCINLVGNTTFGQNTGSGACVYKGKGSGNLLQFKTLVATGSSIAFFETDNEIRVCAIGGTGGTGGTSYTFTNGLSESVGVVSLGGEMTQAATCLCFGTGECLYLCATGGLDHRFAFGAGGTYACYASGANIGTRLCVTGSFLAGYEYSGEYYGLCVGTNYAKLFTDYSSACHFFNVCQSGLTISSNDGTISMKGLNAKTDETCTLYIDADGLLTYGTGGGGSGGFLGNVTCDTAEPTGLTNNQWVRPEPASTGCFNYAFTNFTDSGGTAISVNLSLEDTFLRFCQTGATDAGYWIKESYAKPLSSGYTWVGSSGCTVCELPIVDEWVSSTSELTYTGQKYSFPTHSRFVTDVATCTDFPNIIYKSNIDLNSVGQTCLFCIPTSMNAMILSAKLVMLQDATPDCFVVSIGNCASSLCCYRNMIDNCTISDVLQYETYELTSTVAEPHSKAAPCSMGNTVYIRVQSGTTGTLCANLILQGYLY